MLFGLQRTKGGRKLVAAVAIGAAAAVAAPAAPAMADAYRVSGPHDTFIRLKSNHDCVGGNPTQLGQSVVTKISTSQLAKYPKDGLYVKGLVAEVTATQPWTAYYHLSYTNLTTGKTGARDGHVAVFHGANFKEKIHPGKGKVRISVKIRYEGIFRNYARCSDIYRVR